MIFRGKKRLAVCAVGAFLLCLLLAPSAGTAPSRSRVTSMTTLNGQIVREVNRVRATRGLRPLTTSGPLARAAAKHSRSMATAGFFTHESADGSAFWRRIQRFYPQGGFRSWSVGENLVWASPKLDAKRAVRMWMNSPAHRKNMLSPNWRQIGLSAVHAASAPGEYRNLPVTIVTADFGVRS